MGEIDIGRERLGHFLMLGKLQIIAIGDCVNLFLVKGECPLNGLSDLFSLFHFRFGQNQILNILLQKSSDDSTMPLANDGVAFLGTNPRVD